MTEQSKPKWTDGPWNVFIDDSGDQWSGWPISISPANDDEKSIVRPGGFYPYEWDAATSQREAVANANLIAAAPELAEGVAWLLRELPTNRDWMDPDLERFLNHALAKARGETE